MRSDHRPANQLRDTTITPHYLPHAEGSVLIEAGRTNVICTASVEDRVPPFLRNTGKGWVTAEYGMLPRATSTRTQREASRRQGRRPHAGDSAADRPVAALGHQPAGARRADDLDRLRRHPGRRRHAHGVDHRRVRRAGAGAREAARARRHPDDSADRLRRRHQRRHRRRRAAARSRLRRRLARRSRHEHRQDRRRPVHRGAGHGRSAAVRPRCAQHAARSRRSSASSS